METSKLVSKENKIRNGYGIAAGCIAIFLGFFSQIFVYWLPKGFPFVYFLFSYIAIGILIFISLYLVRINIIGGLVLMIITFVLSVVNDLFFLVLSLWRQYFFPITLIHLIFVIIFLLIGINIGDAAKMWKFNRSN